jgi:hypothetical protein
VPIHHNYKAGSFNCPGKLLSAFRYLPGPNDLAPDNNILPNLCASAQIPKPLPTVLPQIRNKDPRKSHHALIDSRMGRTPANSSSASVSSHTRSVTTLPSGVYRKAANLQYLSRRIDSTREEWRTENLRMDFPGHEETPVRFLAMVHNSVDKARGTHFRRSTEHSKGLEA